jgi:enoyl-[acyl-carrier protein] reductase I
MAGKRGLIMGVANNRSIAWGIAKACADQGAEIALTYQGEAFKKRVEPLAAELGAMSPAIATSPSMETLDAVFAEVEKSGARSTLSSTPSLSPTRTSSTAAMSRRRATTSCKTMDISVYSFTGRRQARRAADDRRRLAADADLLRRREGDAALQRHGRRQGGAGGERALSGGRSRRKNIRVNAISAGPIKTLAASGIGDFRYILKWNEYNSPLKRTVTIEEVGDSGSISCPTCRAASPARSTTSIPAIMSSA